jgi:uncharacterized protein YraI
MASTVFGFAACNATPEPASQTITGEDETATTSQGISGSIPVGSTLIATANVNLRKSASTSSSILHVVPEGSSVTVVSASPSNGFYNIKHNGVTGWGYGAYYKLGTTNSTTSSSSSTTASTGTGTPDPGNGDITDATPDGAILRGKAAAGFSYWWGHGRFRPEGVNGNAGSCSGSCPSCSHSGSYGGDCSGFVAKAWQIPSSNDDLTTDEHPYSTATFVTDSSNWHTVSRDSVVTADALVYHSGGAGHVFLYNSGDGWGSMDVFECKGCAAGCVHDVRTASSAYHGIRHY